MEATIQNGNLIITMPLFPNPRLSSKKKSMLIASSGGAQPLTEDGDPIEVDGKPVVFSGNAYYDARS